MVKVIFKEPQRGVKEIICMFTMETNRVSTVLHFTKDIYWTVESKNIKSKQNINDPLR